MQNFLWKNIVCQFGMLKKITTNNETRFESKEVKRGCQNQQVEHNFSTPTYPQGNGQAR